MASLLQGKISLISKIALLSFVLLGLAIPVHQAQAFVGILAMLIATTVFAIALQLVLIFSYLIMRIAHAILTWVISPAFITLPYTSGGIVDIGWPITRDLANMGFVFALVIIGLATALRLREYEVKKTLPSLIGIILLINFTPVIAGLVVDAANIIMVFFIESVSMARLVAIMQDPVSGVLNSFANLVTANLTGQTTLLAKTGILIVFQLMTAMFFAIFAVLFIVRYIAIWTLVILSPLAFFAYILPTTRRYFSAWWHQFFQWSFVGVVAAFFLYLAEQLLVVMQATPFVSPPSPPGILQPLAEVFNVILPYIVVEAFLLFGFLASLVSGAIGAGAVMSTGKQWSSAAAKTVGGWAGKAGKSWGRAGLEKTGLGEAATKIATRMATYVPKSKLAQVALAPALDLFRATGRKGIGAFSVSGKGEIQAGISEAEKKIESGAVDLVKSEYLSAADTATRIQKLIALANKGKTKDIEELIAKTGTQVSDDVVSAHRIYGRGDEVLKVMPTLPAMEEVIRQKAKLPSAKTTPLAMLTAVQRNKFDNEQKDFFRKMKTTDAGRINVDVFDSTKPAYNAATSEMIIRNWDGRHAANFCQEQGTPAADAIRDTVHRLASTSVPPMSDQEWLEGRAAIPAMPARPHPAIAGVTLPPSPAVPAVPGHNPSLAKYIHNAMQSFLKFDGAGNIV